MILDEPTAGMDPEARATTRAIVADLRDGGAAVLLTSHDLTDVERLADRICVLDGGPDRGRRVAGRAARRGDAAAPVPPGPSADGAQSRMPLGERWRPFVRVPASWPDGDGARYRLEWRAPDAGARGGARRPGAPPPTA